MRCLAVLLAVLACQPSIPIEGEIPTAPRAALLVDNDAWVDVTIYIVRSGVRQRIGLVPAQSEREFAVDRGALINRWAFEVQPQGTRNTRVYTDADLAPLYGYYRFRGPGIPLGDRYDSIQLKVQNKINQSYVGVVW